MNVCSLLQKQQEREREWERRESGHAADYWWYMLCHQMKRESWQGRDALLDSLIKGGSKVISVAVAIEGVAVIDHSTETQIPTTLIHKSLNPENLCGMLQVLLPWKHGWMLKWTSTDCVIILTCRSFDLSHKDAEIILTQKPADV